jgi:hypothetical protein
LPNIIVNLDNQKAIKDITYYAVFVEVDVNLNLLDPAHYTLVKDSDYESSLIDGSYEGDYYRLTVRNNANLKGRITIPANLPYNNTNIPVVVVDGGANNQLTHIFFEDT